MASTADPWFIQGPDTRNGIFSVGSCQGNHAGHRNQYSSALKGTQVQMCTFECEHFFQTDGQLAG